MIKELKRIFADSYVIIIFLLGGLIYPILYGIIYHKGTVDEIPVAVVDHCATAESRRFVRKLDSTREVAIAYNCATMDEAKSLMQGRKVHGIVYFPEDYNDRLASMQQATLSTYADMSSFLYYKDLTMAVNLVMLDEMGQIEASRYAAKGMTSQEVLQMVNAIPVEEEMPFNTNMSFLIFFLSAALVLVIQQTMFFGVSVMNGSMREGGATHDGSLIGRAAAYAVIYIGIAVYGLLLVPMMFGIPQRGAVLDIVALILLFVITCVSFSFTFSRFIHHRETVFVVMLFMSSLCFFLSGVAWPTSAFPPFWRAFSYIFPSTFMIQAFNNVNNAACTLAMVRPQIMGLVCQFAFYSITAFLMDQSERNHYRSLLVRFEERVERKLEA